MKIGITKMESNQPISEVLKMNTSTDSMIIHLETYTQRTN